MGSVIVGPHTAKRLVDIYAPQNHLEDVQSGVVLSTGAKIVRFSPGDGTLNSQFGDHSYLVTGTAEDNADILSLGLEPDPNIFA